MKYIRLFMVSFVLLCFLSISAMASEREAGAEEISRVKNGQAVAYNWENTDGHWKLLYLDAKGKMWRYAKNRWVQIGSLTGMQRRAGFSLMESGTLRSMTIRRETRRMLRLF